MVALPSKGKDKEEEEEHSPAERLVVTFDQLRSGSGDAASTDDGGFEAATLWNRRRLSRESLVEIHQRSLGSSEEDGDGDSTEEEVKEERGRRACW